MSASLLFPLNVELHMHTQFCNNCNNTIDIVSMNVLERCHVGVNVFHV